MLGTIWTYPGGGSTLNCLLSAACFVMHGERAVAHLKRLIQKYGEEQMTNLELIGKLQDYDLARIESLDIHGRMF